MALNDFNMVLLYDPHNVQNLSNLSLTYYAMRFFNEAVFFAKLGLQEAEKQNLHDCDSDFNAVIVNVNAMMRTVVPQKADGM